MVNQNRMKLDQGVQEVQTPKSEERSEKSNLIHRQGPLENVDEES